VNRATPRTDLKDATVSKIVDKILNQVFGREATILIYRYLDCKYHVRRDEITEKIEVFAQGLEEFLNSGAHAIERKILEDIYSSQGVLRKLELEKVGEETDFVSEMKTLVRKA
jgi:hypothetical protein